MKLEQSIKWSVAVLLFFSTTNLLGQNWWTNAGEGAAAGNYGASYGYYAGNASAYQHNYYNSFFGAYSGKYTNASGSYNSFFGGHSGYNNSTGGDNSFFGRHSGYFNTSGSFNNFVGTQSGFYNTTGRYNAFFGPLAGFSNKTGSYNIAIGYLAGAGADVSNGVYIGKYAGNNETTSNKLYIETSASTTPLIWGDFATNDVRINGDLDITQVLTLDYAQINGTANRSGLLEIGKNGNYGWSGVSVEHTSTSAWSFMGNQTNAGIYDDYNNEWALLYDENSYLKLYHNGSEKLRTESWGVNISGDIRSSTGEINSATDHLSLMRGVRADDSSYEWVGYYSDTIRQGIILYDGAWGGANNRSDEFSITAENSNLLTLNTSGNHIALMPKGSGKVGIGTLAPEGLLEVKGAYDGSNSQMIINTTGSNAELRFSENGTPKGFVWYNQPDNAMSFGRGGAANSIHISEAGKVGVGVIPQDNDSEANDTKLLVAGKVNSSGYILEDAFIFDADADNIYLRNNTGTAISITNSGIMDVTIHNDLEVQGTLTFDKNNLTEDNTQDDLLVLRGNGTMATRSVKSIESPWLLEAIEIDPDSTIYSVVQDTLVISQDISVNLFDLNGNISMGRNAYLDDDWEIGDNYDTIRGEYVGDDWIKFSEFIEMRSGHPTKGLVLNDSVSYTEYLNLFHAAGTSYFAHGGYEDYFMKANDYEVEFRDEVRIPALYASVTGSDSSTYIIADAGDMHDDQSDPKSIVFGHNGRPDDETDGSYRELMRLQEDGGLFLSQLSNGIHDSVLVRDVGSGQLFQRHASTFSPWTFTIGGPEIFYEGRTNIGGLANGTTTQLHVGSELRTSLAITSNYAGTDGYGVKSTVTNAANNASQFKAFAAHDAYLGQDVFRVFGDGYVEAKEVLLKLTGWEDRVFAQDYELMPLEEVEEFVQENKHLPEIPSEKEVLEEGLEVANMERLLLKKVEELTLHLIEQNKQMKAQNERIAELEQLINRK